MTSKDRGLRAMEASEVGSLPDTKEGSTGGRESAAKDRSVQARLRASAAPEGESGSAGSDSPSSTAAQGRDTVLVIRFGQRENAEKAREQIVWAMERAHLIPFDIEIEEIDCVR